MMGEGGDKRRERGQFKVFVVCAEGAVMGKSVAPWLEATAPLSHPLACTCSGPSRLRVETDAAHVSYRTCTDII